MADYPLGQVNSVQTALRTSSEVDTCPKQFQHASGDADGLKELRGSQESSSTQSSEGHCMVTDDTLQNHGFSVDAGGQKELRFQHTSSDADGLEELRGSQESSSTQSSEGHCIVTDDTPQRQQREEQQYPIFKYAPRIHYEPRNIPIVNPESHQNENSLNRKKKNFQHTKRNIEGFAKTKKMSVEIVVCVALFLIAAVGTILWILLKQANLKDESTLPNIIVTNLNSTISTSIIVSKEIFDASDSASIIQPDGKILPVNLKTERRKREIQENSQWSFSHERNDGEDNDEFTFRLTGPLATCPFVGRATIYWLDGNTRLGHSSFDIIIPCKSTTKASMTRLESGKKQYNCVSNSTCCKSHLEIMKKHGTLTDVIYQCTKSYDPTEGHTNVCSVKTEDPEIFFKAISDDIGFILNEDIAISECDKDNNPCRHQGHCSVDDENKGYICTCTSGYTGKNCDSEIDLCGSNPCRNGATCMVMNKDFKCTCKEGYAGRTCQTDLDECNSNPCQNYGVCKDDVNHYTCSCLDGFAGLNCETEIDLCAPPPCMTGTCVSDSQNYTCNCDNDHSGRHCELARPGRTCGQGIKCVEHAYCDDSGKCSCKSPYVKSDNGKHCYQECSNKCPSNNLDFYKIAGDICGTTFIRCVNGTSYIENCNKDMVFNPLEKACVCVPKSEIHACSSSSYNSNMESVCAETCSKRKEG